MYSPRLLDSTHTKYNELTNCRKQVQLSKAEAEKDNVVVPTTMEEYCMKPKPRCVATCAHIHCQDTAKASNLFCGLN